MSEAIEDKKSKVNALINSMYFKNEVALMVDQELLAQLVTVKELRTYIFDKLIFSIRHENQIRRMTSVKTLRYILRSSYLNDDVIEVEVLPQLTTLAEQGTLEQRSDIASVIGDIALKSSHLHHTITLSALPTTLVSVLKDGLESIEMKIKHFHHQERQNVVGVNNFLSEFIELLQQGNEYRVEARRIIGGILHHTDDNEDLEQQVALVHNFSEALKNGQDSLRSHYGRELRKIAREMTIEQREALVRSDVVNTIIDLASLPNQPSKADALWILTVLSEDPTIRNVIIEKRGIETLVEILETGEESEQTDAFWALQHMCETPDLRTAIFNAGAIPSLVRFMRKGTYAARLEGLRGLSFLVNDPALSTEDLCEADILRHTLPILKAGPGALQSPAGAILLSLAEHASTPHLQLAFIQSGLISALLSMAISSTESIHTRRHACLILRYLVKDADLRRVLLSEGNGEGIDSLVSILEARGNEGEWRVSVARVIGTIARDESGANYLSQRGALPVLIACLSDGNPRLKQISIEILLLFAADNHLRETLIHAHIRTIVRHIASHSDGALHDVAASLLLKLHGETWVASAVEHIHDTLEDIQLSLTQDHSQEEITLKEEKVPQPAVGSKPSTRRSQPVVKPKKHEKIHELPHTDDPQKERSILDR
jgi:hypothetical protein